MHGEDVAVRLGTQPGNLGFYLPVVPKNSFFKTVIAGRRAAAQGVLHGRGAEKRFYMEARRIEPV